jgi:uroporphyrinogen-III synthase
MRILVTRPEPDAAEQAAKFQALGHEPVLAPLLRIEFLAGDIDLAGVQAIVATSRNALRALASRSRDLEKALRHPLIAVGEATAKTGRALGFADVRAGPGTGAELARMLSESLDASAGALVHVSGEDLAFDLASALSPHGFEVRRSILYRSIPAAELPPNAAALFASGELDGVILMSPRTSSTFVQLIRQHGAMAGAEKLICYCLSEAVAQPLRALRARTIVALRPSEEEVLALIDSGGPCSQ